MKTFPQVNQSVSRRKSEGVGLRDEQSMCREQLQVDGRERMQRGFSLIVFVFSCFLRAAAVALALRFTSRYLNRYSRLTCKHPNRTRHTNPKPPGESVIIKTAGHDVTRSHDTVHNP